jgi:hypothetical protein
LFWGAEFSPRFTPAPPLFEKERRIFFSGELFLLQKQLFYYLLRLPLDEQPVEVSVEAVAFQIDDEIVVLPLEDVSHDSVHRIPVRVEHLFLQILVFLLIRYASHNNDSAEILADLQWYSVEVLRKEDDT